MGDFVISPLPRLLTKELCAAGPLCSTGVAPFQRYYKPSRHRLVFDRFPGASGYAVYLAPSISRRDEDGFSSGLACPCHRAVPTTPPEGCASSDSLATHPVAFVRHEKTRPLGSIFLSGPPCSWLRANTCNTVSTESPEQLRPTACQNCCHETDLPLGYRRPRDVGIPCSVPRDHPPTLRPFAPATLYRKSCRLPLCRRFAPALPVPSTTNAP